jgi:hypothetical protein
MSYSTFLYPIDINRIASKKNDIENKEENKEKEDSIWDDIIIYSNIPVDTLPSGYDEPLTP